MDFWEMIQKIVHGYKDEDIEIDLNDNGLVEYSPEMLSLYNYVITAHAPEDDSKLTISFFKPEQWEMVLSTAELTNSTAEDIVRGLTTDDVHQIVISANEWNPDDDLGELF